MREIKFRAWDKDTKQLFTNAQITFNLFWNEPKRFELTQYTGLKDKNDKEIYEGDILVSHEAGNKHTVVFEIGAFALSRPDGWRQLLNHASDNNGQVLETIIGNIYESSELLEVRNGS